jgi:ABC-type enterochelin transport system substrate-binding protein
MSKSSKFILHDIFNEPLNEVTFNNAKKEYLKSINENVFSLPSSNNILEQIKLVKRTPQNIGPYKELTVFETLNRIGSDLVLLSGVQQLFTGIIKDIKPKTIKLNMGNKSGFDFIVTTINNEVINGEAFNAAASFAKVKMRQTIDKLTKDIAIHKSNKSIIFCNSDIKAIINGYKNQKEKEVLETSDFIIHKVFCVYEAF